MKADNSMTLTAATKLCDTVTEYTRQGVSRSILMNAVRDTCEVIQRGGGRDITQNQELLNQIEYERT